MKLSAILPAALLFTVFSLTAAPTTFDATRPTPQANRRMTVEDGVLRWTDDRSEVALFGVNYYPPFYTDYSSLKRLGIDPHDVIREDLAHFQRLGLSSLRLHTFDREFSDQDGNFLDNEHVELLDFLIAECGKRNIYVVLTAIAWWGTPNPLNRAFSSLYPEIRQMVSQPEAWKIQANFLCQYGRHVNRYTHLTYAEDPIIPVFELINEPLYPKGMTDDQVVDYINALVDGLRASGTTKPIFFNTWQDKQIPCSRANIQGVTQSWYPSGLINGHELKEDYLDRVNDFPALRHPALASRAKMIYEFDCADILNPTMYPAMARTFRSVGVQIANQFAYDALRLAPRNTSYQTHYLNLAYTPPKAIAFAIAARAFREIPRLTNFDPKTNRTFGPVTLSHDKRLAQYVSDTDYLYANHTDTPAPNPAALQHVWGVGNSPLLTSTGNGAVFLDRLAPGDWLLEVYPAQVMVNDPFSSGSREKIRLYGLPVTLTVNLPDLNAPAVLTRLDAPAEPIAYTPRTPFTVTPGQYRLTCRNTAPAPDSALPNRDFVLPPVTTDLSPIVSLSVPEQFLPGQMPFTIHATGFFPSDISDFTAVGTTPDGRRLFAVPFQPDGRLAYRADVPAETLRDAADCLITARLTCGGVTRVYPGGLPLQDLPQADAPSSWNVFTASPEACLPPAKPNVANGQTVFLPDQQVLQHTSPGYDGPINASGMRLPLHPLPPDAAPNAIRITVAGDNQTTALEIGLVQNDKFAFGFNVPLTPIQQDFVIPFDRFNPLWNTGGSAINPQRLSELSLLTGKWLAPALANRPHSFTFKALDFIRLPHGLRTHILNQDAPLVISSYDNCIPPKPTKRTAITCLVSGPAPGSSALMIQAPTFADSPDSSTVKLPVNDSCRPLLSHYRNASTLLITIRATHPQTNMIEIVFREKDGAPWGVHQLPITTDWQEIAVPIKDLKFFKHWHPQCPPERGRDGDCLKIENLNVITTCFGKFLYHDTYDQPHGYIIGSIRLR